MKPALLVIDVQKAFLKYDPATTQSLTHAIETINAAIALFRNKQLPVIAIQHLDPEQQLTPETDGFALPEQLNILPSDLHIIKAYSNAFNKNALADELQKLAVDTLILTGYCAEYCVLATCVGAEDQDLTPIILRGGLASGNPKAIRLVEDINDSISLGALKKMLEWRG